MKDEVRNLDFYRSELYGDDRDLIIYAKDSDGFLKAEVSGCHFWHVNGVRRGLNIRAENGFVHIRMAGVAVFPLKSLNPFGRFLYKLITKLGFYKQRS